MVEDSEPGTPSARGGLALRRRDLVALLLLLVIVGVLVAVVFRPVAGPRAPGGETATHAAGYDGAALASPKPAPPLALRNYLGTPVDLASYRGRAVLVTFLYTHCPDVCPLIASHLHTTLAEMSAEERREVQIIAVSVDPRGDTPSTVARFLAAHEMTGSMQYLIGSETQLSPVWKAWGVSAAPTTNPDVVDHSALIYGISAHGKVVTIYLSNFSPRQIIHDVPLLARA
jgi:protein SCO1/2